ncbi:MAG: tetratricopeptide repeat protein [Pseudomonadota bacterium]|nr:tetratricopeptide repeat protein [Pseudomonadota bacterium]
MRLSTELFAAGPVSLLSATALALPAATIAIQSRRIRRSLVIVAGTLVLFTDTVARVSVWLVGYAGLPTIAAATGFVTLLSLGGPLTLAAARAGRGPWSAGVAAFIAGVWLGPVPLLGVILGAGFGVALLDRETPTSAQPPRRALGAVALPALAALPIFGVVAVLWVLGRAALDPTVLGFVALVAGLALGAIASPGGWAILPGLALAGGACWAALTRLGDVLDASPHAGLAVFAALGLGVGPLLRAARVDRVSAAVSLAAVALLLPAALHAVPVDLAARAAEAHAANATSRERLQALRESATVAWAGIGPAGAAALYRRDRHVILELDGGLADADTRAGAAERFAGTLAACATDGRTRARVGGDDLGLAVEGLRAQGFLAIDASVPDADLVRAQAEAVPSLGRTWLHPSVRLVALPAPALLRAGPPADAVVEIARSPFTGARATFPDRRALRAVRAGLAAGGVHVLAVPTTTLGAPALRALLLDFVAVYPGASAWLPPEGADTVLLVGPASGAPLPWSGIERCVTADPAGLEAVSLRSAIDLGALAFADGRALASVPAGRPVGLGLPASLRAPPGLPLTSLGALSANPATVFTGAPEAALAARAPSRTLLLELLQEATTGDVRDAFARARALGEVPGGARALEPVVRPHLVRARQAMAVGKKEGVTSKAWEDAEAAIATARALAPSFALTRCLEGELAGERGQLSRAEESFAKCAELDPTGLRGHEGLAQARRSRGDLLGTEAALRAAHSARPDLWTTAQNLGYFLFEHGRYDEAERLLKQATAIQSRAGANAGQPAPYLALAGLYLETGRAELALAQAERAAAFGPNPQTFALRGAARRELRQLDEAERDYRAALDLDATHVLARGGLAQVQADRGEYELAAASWQAILVKDPDNVQARENLRRIGPLLKEAQGP